MCQLSHHCFIHRAYYGIVFIHLLLTSTLTAIFILALKSEAVNESSTAKAVDQVSEMPLATEPRLICHLTRIAISNAVMDILKIHVNLVLYNFH